MTIRKYFLIAICLRIITFLPTAAAGASCTLSLPMAKEVSIDQICTTSFDDRSCANESSYPEFKKYLQNTTVIGITGFHNEEEFGSQDHFDMVRHTMQSAGGEFVMVRTDSYKSIESDTPVVCKKVKSKIYQAKPNVIIIAQSKGGAAAQYFGAVCPEIFSMVNAVVLHNAVLHGSFYADSVAQLKVEWGDIAKTLKHLGKPAFSCLGYAAAGASLTSTASNLRLLQAKRSAHPEKTFCVRSWAPAGRLGYGEKIGTGPTAPKPNDGLVAFSSQSSSDVGLCTDLLSVSNAHHGSLVDRGSDSGISPSCRQAYAAYLLRLVQNQKPHENFGPPSFLQQ